MLRASWYWGQVHARGVEHAMRAHWNDEHRYHTACNDRRLYTDLELYSVDTEPSGGSSGPCLQPACRRARRAWLKVYGVIPSVIPSEGPHRIQLQRVKGWRLPANTVVIGRCGQCVFCGGRRTGPLRGIAARRPCYGNPFTVAGALESGFAATVEDAQKLCAEAFESWINGESTWAYADGERRLEWLLGHLADLRGRNVGCWCGLARPCHGDPLMRAANA